MKNDRARAAGTRTDFEDADLRRGVLLHALLDETDHCIGQHFIEEAGRERIPVHTLDQFPRGVREHHIGCRTLARQNLRQSAQRRFGENDFGRDIRVGRPRVLALLPRMGLAPQENGPVQP